MLENGLKSPKFYNSNYFQVILRCSDGDLIVTNKYLKKDLDDYDLNKYKTSNFENLRE